MLSSRPLKLWSHRYVCAAIAVRVTELFTSSSFSYSLTTDVVLCPFFLTLLISSRSTTVSALILPFFTLRCSLCLVFFPMPHSASSLPPLTPLLFLTPISLTTPFLLYLSALCLSPILSALRRFSAITPLHLLIPVLIQPSTHSYLTSKYTTQTYMHAHPCARLPTAQMSPEEPGVSTRSHSAYCAEKCPL